MNLYDPHSRRGLLAIDITPNCFFLLAKHRMPPSPLPLKMGTNALFFIEKMRPKAGAGERWEFHISQDRKAINFAFEGLSYTKNP